MTRDYKPATSRTSHGSKSSGFLSGLLVGLALGVGISIGVALLVKGGNSPFVAKVTPASQAGQEAATSAAKQPDSAEGKTPAKPRFDFYTILPGSESQVTEQQAQQTISAQQETPTAAGSKSYFLQVGAFQNEQDADNLKAQLALLGMEAVVQTANTPDKGVSHRVRVGPLTDIEQIRKTRAELTKNGFSAYLIQQNNSIPDQ